MLLEAGEERETPNPEITSPGSLGEWVPVGLLPLPGSPLSA